MSFTNILTGGAGGNGDDFDIFSVEAAAELAPVPAGRYVAIAERGGPKTARTGTRGYEIQFRVTEGEHAGRKVWKFFPFTPKAGAISRRDLQQFGFTTIEQLGSELPVERFVAEIGVSLRADPATGNLRNDVKSIKVIRVEAPKPDPFAPAAAQASTTVPPEAPSPEGSEGDGGTLFGPDGPADALGGLRR